jgi:hypothetical protein
MRRATTATKTSLPGPESSEVVVGFDFRRTWYVAKRREVLINACRIFLIILGTASIGLFVMAVLSEGIRP